MDAWVEFLTEGMIGRDVPGVGLLYAVTLKLSAGNVFVILRAKGGGGHVVAFTGAANLKKAVEKIRPLLLGEGGKWTKDKYA